VRELVEIDVEENDRPGVSAKLERLARDARQDEPYQTAGEERVRDGELAAN